MNAICSKFNWIHLIALGSQILLSNTRAHVGNAVENPLDAVTDTTYLEEGVRCHPGDSLDNSHLDL